MQDSRVTYSVCPQCDKLRVADGSGKFPRLFSLREFKCLSCYFEFEVSWQRRLAYVFLFASIQIFLWVAVITVFVDSPNWIPAAIAGALAVVSGAVSSEVRGSVGWFQPWLGGSRVRTVINTVGAVLIWLFPITLLVTFISSCTGQQ